MVFAQVRQGRPDLAGPLGLQRRVGMNDPDHLTDDILLPGLSLDFGSIWEPGF